MTRIVDKIELDSAATGGSTATVAEPSVASSGQRIIVAGNWFTSRSTDGGTTWKFISPFNEFDADSGGFCCDQVVTYVKSYRLWVWLLQYRVRNQTNIFRLAVSKSGASGSWTWWDTTAADIDPSWADLQLDYPDVLAGPDHLWISFNLYRSSDSSWERALVMRFRLDELEARGLLNREAWSTDRTGALRFARGAGGRMWFAGHSDNNQAVHLFSWASDETQVDEFMVDVTPWNESNYRSLLADNINWLQRADGRITACWARDANLGLAWGAGAGSQRPQPFIRSVRIALDTMTVIDEPDIWSSDRAWGYPAVGVNQRGEPGISAFFGGSAHGISHAVGRLSDGAWDMEPCGESTHGPGNGGWGDYVEVHPDPRRKTYWMASGFTLQGSGGRTSIVPQVVTFAP